MSIKTCCGMLSDAPSNERRAVGLVLILVFGLAFAWSAQAADWHERARTLFERLVDTPTVAGRGRIPEIAAYLAEQYRVAGIPKEDILVKPYNDTAALIVRWRAPGHLKHKAILLLAHLDVVEARREDWSIDPFKLVEKDGYFYGRGTLDDKSGVVGITIALLQLKAEGFRPRRDITVLFTGDEETDEQGGVLATSEWRQWTDAEYVLNADGVGGTVRPTGHVVGFYLQTAEKTYASYSFTVRNRGGHSSEPRPDNAIYQLATALKRLQRHRFEPSLNETTRAYFSERQKAEKGALGNAMRRWLANEHDGAAADVIEADPREVGLTRTTCVVTRIEGGHADNALPQLARAIVNCRIMPGIAVHTIRSELIRVVADPGVGVELTQVLGGASGSPLRKDVLCAFGSSVHKRFPNAPIIPQMTPYGTESANFRASGIPAYGVEGTWIVEPNDMRMHGRDERIPVKSLYDNVDHWHDLVATLAGESRCP